MLQIKNSFGKKCAKPNANKVYKMGELIHFYFSFVTPTWTQVFTQGRSIAPPLGDQGQGGHGRISDLN